MMLQSPTGFKTLSGTSTALLNSLTCPYILSTLEGNISLLTDVEVESCAIKSHSQSAKPETINSPSTLYSLRMCDDV